jgi:hypothetical protein
MEIANWDEKSYSQVQAGPKLTLSVIVHKVTGDIEGEGKLDYLMVYLDEQTTRFLGYEQIIGRIGKRSGSFVLRHDGSYEAGVATVALSVVPGSGTGDLGGIRGSGDFRATDAKSSAYTLNYSFD